MAQHVLLLTVAPPLIVLSAPWSRLWQPLPLDFRRRGRGGRARPVGGPSPRCGRRRRPTLSAWVLFNGNLVAWHVPALYDATLRNPAVHDLEHAPSSSPDCFLAPGVRLAALPRGLALARRVVS